MAEYVTDGMKNLIEFTSKGGFVPKLHCVMEGTDITLTHDNVGIMIYGMGERGYTINLTNGESDGTVFEAFALVFVYDNRATYANSTTRIIYNYNITSNSPVSINLIMNGMVSFLMFTGYRA